MQNWIDQLLSSKPNRENANTEIGSLMDRNKKYDKGFEKEISPKSLAYIGDAVYELYIRVKVFQERKGKTKKMHKASVAQVKADAQAKMLKKIEPYLNEEERKIVRRGRNTKGGRPPRKIEYMVYKCSTAFETLIGYLYLKGRTDRIIDLLERR